MTSIELRERIMRAIFDADCTIWNDHTEAFEDDDHIHLGAEADAVLAVIQAARDERRAAFVAALQAYGRAKYAQGNDPGLDTRNRADQFETHVLALYDAAFGGAEEVTG